MFKHVSKQLLDQMTSNELLRHAHNDAIFIDAFLSRKSLTDFFHIVGVGNYNPSGEPFGSKEFPVIISAKEYPI